jgi:hypothetical protein
VAKINFKNLKLNNMIKHIKQLISKYIGDIQYIVTIINVSLSVQKHQFNTTKQVDEFVDEINDDTYWMIHKIDKIRMFDFKYNKKIKHTPLHFQHGDVTEIVNLEDWDYSFLKKDKSLNNIIRISGGEKRKENSITDELSIGEQM